jgi:hypothetical protein
LVGRLGVVGQRADHGRQQLLVQVGELAGVEQGARPASDDDLDLLSGQGVDLPGDDGAPDPQGALARPHPVPERIPGLQAGDAGRLRPLRHDEQRVV